MRTDFLSFSPPALSEAEINEVTAVLRDGRWLTTGPKTKQFEEDFCARVRAPAALALNSCTAGLHLALLAHHVGPGDEVITTPMTFCATANVIEHVGATVRLADVDPDTLLIDPEQIARYVTPRTKIILPVHYAGQPCDLGAIQKLADAAGAAVIEDAAHCLPSTIDGRPVGGSDNLTAFSFYATKNITTGEGGMLTGRADLVLEARRLALHGMSRGSWDRFAKGGQWRYDVPEPGFKYNLTDIASALGVVQLRRLDELYALRMRVVEIYDAHFAGSKFFKTLGVRPDVGSSHHLYVLRLRPDVLTIGRDQFIAELHERNIGASVHYIPIHRMSYYARKYDWTPASFPVASEAGETMMSIPLSSALTADDAGDVTSAIDQITAKFAR